MPSDQQRVKAIFDEAAEIAGPEDRAAYLEGACGGNDELRRKIDALLRALDVAGSLLESPPDLGATSPRSGEPTKSPTLAFPSGEPIAGSPPTVDPTAGATSASEPSGEPRPVWPYALGLGSTIGPYKLVQKLGEGGMGAVYLAEQEKPVRRRVALKVVKPGMDTEQIVARFEAERQALAILDHPGIAKILDAGATDSGRPYFVMELVKGVSITEYCDAVHLNPKERLELFIPVCQAVQHAHQKGIIHRDIKPSNVLITMKDGKPVPKIIDFGIAKAIDQRLTEKTFFTQHGAIVGTLEYMSPEQAEISAMDVDTRTDIYALGVLLYELLTGSTPLQRARLRQAAYSEILRRIREEEPPKPSTRLSESRDELPSVAALRKTDPARLTRLVRGDLDWIVMRALEKDRTRRYQTASGFAIDVQRHLDGDPVEAGPPSALYKLGKYARKHRAALAVVAAFAALLVVATVVSTALAISASRARDLARTALAASERARTEAQTINNFLVSSFGKPDPELDGAKVLVVDLLDGAAADLDLAYPGSPVVKGTLLTTLSHTYYGLGQYAKSEALRLRARDVFESALGQGHPDALKSRTHVAEAYLAMGKTAEAIALHETTRTLQESTLGPDHADTLRSRSRLAQAYLAAGRTSDAIELLESTLKLQDSNFGSDDPDTLETRASLATAYQAGGRAAEAVELFQSTLKHADSKLGPMSPRTLALRSNLALALRAAGQRKEADAMSEATLKLIESKFGPEHPSALISRANRASHLLDLGRSAEAAKLFETTLQPIESKFGPEHPTTLKVRNSLASAYRALGKTAEAIKLLETTLQIRTSTLGADHPDTLQSRNNLANCYADAGRTEDAVKLNEGTLKLREAKLGPDHPETLQSRSNLAATYRLCGRTAEAIKLLEGTLELMESKQGPEHPSTLRVRGNLAVAFRADGRIAKAIALHEKNLKFSESTHGPDHPYTLQIRNNLATAYRDAGKTAEAAAMLEPTLNSMETAIGPDHPDTLRTRASLAAVYLFMGKMADGIAMLEATLKLQELKPGPDHPDTFITRENLINAYQATGQLSRAEPLLRSRANLVPKRFGPENPRTAAAMAELGANLLSQHKWTDAEAVLRKSLAIREKVQADDWVTANTRSMVGECLLSGAKYAEAEPLIVEGYEGLRAREAKIPGFAKARPAEAGRRIVRLYEAWGKPAQAAKWKAKLGIADLPSAIFTPP